MDMSQYRELFVSEASGYLTQISELVLRLEQLPADQEAVAALFRSTHSLKGMASTMSYGALATLAHRLEDLMDQVRSGRRPFTPPLADLLLTGADTMAAMVADVAAGNSPERDITALVAQLSAFAQAQVTEPESSPPLPPPEAVGHEPPGLASPPATSIRIRTQTLDRLIDMSGELLTIRHRFAALTDGLVVPGLAETVDHLSGLVRKLHQEVLSVRTLPIATVTDRFPRMLRDLARQQGKELEFVVEGQGLELDRSILDQLAEPLTHLLRNAVDHGLERQEERLAGGKNPAGRITLTVGRDQDHAVISVTDDGRGMDHRHLVQAARDKGVISAAEAERLSPAEALQLICRPGFSTAATLTETSGRGVGMDAVLATVQALGGSLAISSAIGTGSQMTLRLPTSVAIIAVLLVTAGPFTFAVPARNIRRTMDLHRHQIIQLNGRPYARFAGEEIPLYSLNRRFGLPLPPPAASWPLCIVERQGGLVGYVVERFRGQQEIFVRPLGRPLAAISGLAGAAVLGDGTVVYVLDVPRLH